ncbi:MAG: xanthine dehydrogenase accessory protein XdhC [Pseudomonadota bacterium]|nr:xanthine dehydrogenase accessory protein XdhC [Pseudomonadota bacterium]
MSAILADPAWWQRLPECLAQGRDGVLVTVVRAEGSTPRGPGATMLVEADRSTDTLGGGNLEFEAIANARRLLAGAAGQALVPYTLGPGLRQCCGGAVWLLYERIAASPAHAAQWQDLGSALQRGGRVLRRWNPASTVSQWTLVSPEQAVTTRFDPRSGAHWQQLIGAEGFALRLFGAGHVGRALARVLAATEARLQWIDPRPEMAEPVRRLGLVLRHCEDPVDAVHDAPPGACFLVVTHSHTLDFELVEAILQRRDARFCGLIGSATKAARFRHNLRRQGLDAATIAGLSCPLGVPGIDDKSPAAIAIAVAAQLLQHLEAARTAGWRNAAAAAPEPFPPSLLSLAEDPSR